MESARIRLHQWHIRVSNTRARVRTDTSAYARVRVVYMRIGYARAHVRRSQEFGGMDKLEALFKDKATKVFGSGWVWLGWQIARLIVGDLVGMVQGMA